MIDIVIPHNPHPSTPRDALGCLKGDVVGKIVVREDFAGAFLRFYRIVDLLKFPTADNANGRLVNISLLKFQV